MIPLFADLTQGYDLLHGTHGTISTETDTDSSAIDLQDYDGPVHLIAHVGASGDGSTVITFKLVEDAASGGSYTEITGASKVLTASATANDNTTHMIFIPNWKQRYVKTRVTTLGGTPSVDVSVSVLARKKIGGGSGIKTDG